MIARRALWGLIASYAAFFSWLSIQRDRSFETGRFDLGNMVQAVWATAHGHPLRVTSLQGDQISRLAAHADPILVVFAPLWWLWPSASLLLVAQALAIALGALPVYGLARRHLGSPRAALGFAAAYLLLPATQWLTLNEFHPVALATPLLLAAFLYLDADRLLPFALFAVAAALCKEEIPLVVAGFGIWYAVERRRWRAGGAIVAAGLAWFGVAIELVIPHYNAGAASSFYSRYGEVGGSPGGLARTALTRPWQLVATAAGHWRYVVHLAAPFAGLWLLAPLVLVAALPDLAINLLSATKTQTSVHFHYTAGLIPPLVIASIFGARRLPRPELVAAGLVAVALASNYLLGAIPLWREFPHGETYGAFTYTVSAHDRAAQRAVNVVPSGVVVSASNSLGAHLSARRRVLSFPFLQDATWAAVDEKLGSFGDRGAPLPATLQIVRLRQNPAWTLVFEQDGVLVFRRA